MSKNFPSPPADPVSRDAHAAAPLSTAPPEHATPRRMRAALLLLAVLALAAWLVHRAGVWGADRAVQELATHARAAAQLNTVALRSSLDKFRSVPFVLAQDPEVRATLLAPEPERILQLDHKLTALSRGVGASAIYLLDMTGLAIAASNWFNGRGAVAWMNGGTGALANAASGGAVFRLRLPLAGAEA